MTVSGSPRVISKRCWTVVPSSYEWSLVFAIVFVHLRFGSFNRTDCKGVRRPVGRFRDSYIFAVIRSEEV